MIYTFFDKIFRDTATHAETKIICEDQQQTTALRKLKNRKFQRQKLFSYCQVSI